MTMMTQSPLVEMRDIAKAYGAVRVLEGVGLTLTTGEVRCLAGENGSGKSTLIKILSGVVAAQEGQIYFDGVPFEGGAEEAIKRGLSVIYQDFALFPNLSVWENISFLRQMNNKGLFHNRFSSRRHAVATLARMQLDLDPDALVEQLPVAQKQLVAIVRALVNEARIIVMDEPTTALTRSEVQKLLGLVRLLKAQGLGFLFVSHKIEEVFAVCDSVTILRDGKVVGDGAIEQFTPASLVEMMSGRAIDSQRLPRDEKTAPTPAFKIRNLTRRGEFDAIDLDLRAGEIISIVGLLGSGRTELGLCLFGSLPADGGTIEDVRAARLLTIKSPAQAMDYGIAYVPEDRQSEGLFLSQSIGDNIVISSLEQSIKAGIASLSRLGARSRAAVQRLKIKTPGIAPAVVTLSGGNQQRVVLARWVERQPKLLILNGPTVGVDVASKREIHELLLALSRNGTAVLVITDDIGEALALSDNIKVMVRGRIIASHPATQWTEETLSAQMTGEAA